MGLFDNIYKGRKILITGHSGFKGSWLALWLSQLGAKLLGVSLRPQTTPNHWELLNIDCESKWLDIRDDASLKDIVKAFNPEVIFHLAAQPLVRRSYRDPLETWQTNVIGSVNILEAARECSDLQAIVCITTDKCYDNREWCWGYRENDALGGHDPYSASKAAVEIAVASYRKSFFSGQNASLLASARAGNVIGGADWSEDRIIPDLVRAMTTGKSLEIRSPKSTRPWQHVLECLYGYLLLGEKLLAKRCEFAEAWNFGPDESSNCSVASILGSIQKYWPELAWFKSATVQPHEAGLLHLDSSKAKKLLGWRPVWNLDKTLEKTAEWYRNYYSNGEVLSLQQLNEYQAALSMNADRKSLR